MKPSSALTAAGLLAFFTVFASAAPMNGSPQLPETGWSSGLRYRPVPSWWVEYKNKHIRPIPNVMEGATVLPSPYLDLKARIEALEKLQS